MFKNRLNLPLLIFILLGSLVELFVLAKLSIFVLALFIGFGFLLFSISKPEWTLVSVIFFIPASTTFSFAAGPGIPALNFNRIAVPAIFLGYLIKNWKNPGFKTGISLIEKLMIIFCVLVLLTTFTRFNFGDFIKVSLYFSDCLILPFIYFYLAKNLLWGEDQFKWISRLSVWTSLFIACCGIYEFQTKIDLIPVEIDEEVSLYEQGLREYGSILRSNGPFAHPEPYGIVLGMLFFVVLYKLFMSWNQNRTFRINIFFLLGVLAVCFTGIFLSMFRAIVLGVIVGFVSRIIFFRKAIPKFIIVGIFFLMITLVSWDWFSSTTLYKERIGDSETGYTRIATWIVGLKILPKYLLWGAGFSNYKEVQEYYPYVVTYKGFSVVPQPHNTLLHLAVETGIWGLLCFSTIVLLIVHYIFKYNKLFRGLNHREFATMMFGMFFVILVPSFTLGIYNDPQINGLFFLFSGILVGRVQRYGLYKLNVSPESYQSPAQEK